MNFPRYCTLYSQFHGCLSFRNEQDIIILDFADLAFDPWSILHMMRYDSIAMNTNQRFIQACKLLFKSDAPVTVFCKKGSWTALLGNTKTIMPMTENAATFQLYATPFFVQDPTSITEYLQGLAFCTSDTIFMYKNCVLYLDEADLPYPGGCYFQSRLRNNSLYRICLLSQEPVDKVLEVALEWRSRRDVMTIPFPTVATLTNPCMIPFQPVGPPNLIDVHGLGEGCIQKRLSMQNPNFLIQDVILSYYRNNPNTDALLCLVLEWPLIVTYEGARTTDICEHKKYVVLSINTQKPNRMLFSRYPYDVYAEFGVIPWDRQRTVIQFVHTILNLPKDMLKVTVDSVVMGYVYKGAFYCFSHPVLEGRPSPESDHHVEFLFSVAKEMGDAEVKETFRINDKYALNRIQHKDVPYPAWCITQAEDTHRYVKQKHLPPVVSEWLNLFQNSLEQPKQKPIDVKMTQMALTLARHKICYKTIMTHGKRTSQISLSDKEIEMRMNQPEVEFINSVRVASQKEIEMANPDASAEGCSIM